MTNNVIPLIMQIFKQNIILALHKTGSSSIRVYDSLQCWQTGAMAPQVTDNPTIRSTACSKLKAKKTSMFRVSDPLNRWPMKIIPRGIVIRKVFPSPGVILFWYQTWPTVLTLWPVSKLDLVLLTVFKFYDIFLSKEMNTGHAVVCFESLIFIHIAIKEA